MYSENKIVTLSDKEEKILEIKKTICGCTVVMRFTACDNEQVQSIVKDMLLKSYTDKLFCQNT